MEKKLFCAVFQKNKPVELIHERPVLAVRIANFKPLRSSLYRTAHFLVTCSASQRNPQGKKKQRAKWLFVSRYSL